tara:strand:- start:153 stop:737 length:585 start_codon:yes stop_codon:yes gene_type:complete
MALGKGIKKAFEAVMKSRAGRAANAGQGMLTGVELAEDASKLGSNLNWLIPGAYFGAEFGQEAILDPILKAGANLRPGTDFGPFHSYEVGVDPYTQQIRDHKAQAKRREEALRIKMRADELQARATRAAMQLAASDPHLYNEIMAGRQLPRDAVVFGGQPRVDLMEELAMGMAQGQFAEEPSAQQQLMQELGVN